MTKVLSARMLHIPIHNKPKKRSNEQLHLNISRQNSFHLFFLVSIVRMVFAHMKFSHLRLDCYQKISRRHTSPVLHVIMTSCALRPGPDTEKRPPAVGISVLKCEPTSAFKNVAMQLSQMSIAALFFAIRTSSLYH